MTTNRPQPLKSLGGAAAPLREYSEAWSPPPLGNFEDTGLSKLNVADLLLKVLYFSGDLTGHQIAEIVKLPFTNVLDSVIRFIKDEKYVEVRGASGIGEIGFRYVISGKGIEKAQEAMQRNQYAGPAPVSLEQYIQAIRAQNREKRIVRQEHLRKVMTNLVISDEMLSKVGPAANSGTSIFLFGPPGNGKTTIAEKIGQLILGDDMWIPFAFDVDGQIVKVFDDINHVLSDTQEPVKHGTGLVQDPRWIRIKRPIIVVGGELTMAGLDLTYDEINKFYEAPYQVKANGGMFLIDDFGRQQVRPSDLLNRWIVPLEKAYDFLTLNNGRKIQMPFSVMIVFSTNMDPKDLVDDAFLRRIRHKIEVGNPTYEQFREIFEIVCRLKQVPFDEKGLAYLLKKWYIDMDRDLRFVHPRDLLTQLIDIAAYLDRTPRLERDLLDRAAASYFVEL
jgi:predicted ATPase with chaperone activity